MKIPRYTGVVSPYGAATDHIFTKAGTIRHTQFSTTDHQLGYVSLFIRSKTGITFSGTKMMIAEWDSVLKFYERPVSSTPYQVLFGGWTWPCIVKISTKKNRFSHTFLYCPVLWNTVHHVAMSSLLCSFIVIQYWCVYAILLKSLTPSLLQYKVLYNTFLPLLYNTGEFISVTLSSLQ